jgi:hypothetical protein
MRCFPAILPPCSAERTLFDALDEWRCEKRQVGGEHAIPGLMSRHLALVAPLFLPSKADSPTMGLEQAQLF